MKKLLALLLTFCLTFYCGTAAFADNVSAVAATSTGNFQIDNTSIAVKVGESAVITAYENGSPTMNATWTVSNPSIASVSNGLVTGRQLGTTTVTATNNAGESVTCYVHVVLKGIDVSSWQGNIDWGTVKNQGIDFAIIRTGYGKTAPEVQTDAYFAQNYSGATANGIKVGVYHFSYAETVEDALQEADFCLSILNGRELDYPVFYDIEDTVHRTMDTNLMADIVEAFCGKMEAAGYRTGVYSSVNIFNSNLSSPRLDKYDRWVASWGRDVANLDKAYTIWQYAYGTLAGISGNVDLNYSFKDYSQAGTPVVPSNPSTPSTPSITCDTASYTFGSNDVYYYKVFTSSATQPTATSSNPSAVSVTFGKKVSDGYIFQINNVGAGTATITTTTAEGASVSFQATGNKSATPALTCDTSSYTFSNNSVYYYKVFTNSVVQPTATSSNPAVVSVTFGKKVSDGYIFQINNVGTGTAVITTTTVDGASVSFQATGNKSVVSSTLTCDTTSPYTFGSNSTYYYKVFTNSATQPVATSSNPSAVSVTFGKKVSDGYIFQINNVGTGTAVITTTTADGASVSFQATGTRSTSSGTPLRCDTTSPYTFGSNSTYYYKVFTTSATQPTATSSNPSAVSVTFGKKVSDGYIFQINNVGTGTAVITTTVGGSSVSFQATGNRASSTGSTSTGSLTCDTTYPFTIRQGNIYTFLFTPNGNVGTPQFTTGNSNVLITAGLKLRNGSYLLTVKGVGAGSTGVYATIPGQAPVNYCTVNVQ